MVEIEALYHFHVFDDGREDHKFLGLFTSPATVSAAIAAASVLPGFSDAPDGFRSFPVILDGVTSGNFGENPTVYFVLRNRQVVEDSDTTDGSDMIGAYIDESVARRKMAELEPSAVAGEEYYLMDVELDERAWLEGYVTCHPGDHDDD